MKRAITLLSVGLASVGVFLLLGTLSAAAGNTKVKVCHVPPGNPDNFHTITISEKAVPAHLAHGDLLGACGDLCEQLCDDGDACTIDDCDPAGGCAAPTPVDCDDGLGCTIDSCDPVDGCLAAPIVCVPPADLCQVSMCVEPNGECMIMDVACGTGEVCNPDTGLCEASGTCEELCEAEAQQLYDRCVAEGGSEVECAELAREFRVTCIAETCYEPPTCVERCEKHAEEQYDRCVAEGGSEVECAELARAELEECVAENCEPP